MKKRKIVWSKEEDATLKENYRMTPRVELMKMLPRRTWQSITSRVKLYPKIRRFHCKGYTKKEEEIINKNFSRMPKRELMKLLPNRSWEAILVHGEKMGLRRKLISCYKKVSVNLNDFDRGYIVGMIDGEGSVVTRRVGDSLRVEISITNTNLECIKRIKKMLGIGRIYEDFSRRKRSPKLKKVYKLQINRTMYVIELLKILMKESTIKKKKARKGLIKITDWLERIRDNGRPSKYHSGEDKSDSGGSFRQCAISPLI